jgi:ankyrin repeat protein
MFVSEDFFEALYGDDSVELRRLIARGVDVNRRDRGGTAPIYLVAGNVEKARLLLGAGADPNVQSPEGTALGFAACWGMDEAVEVLLAGGADPNLVDGEDGFPTTPLMWAAEKGHVGVARSLLEHGADPNLSPAEGRTPLMAAARRGSLAVARLLVEHGADRTAVDDEGRSAFDFAQEWTDRDIEAHLGSHLEQVARTGDEIQTKRTQLADGTQLVELDLPALGRPGHRQQPRNRTRADRGAVARPLAQLRASPSAAGSASKSGSRSGTSG